MTMLARLKPYNAKKGHVTRTYLIDGRRFLEDKGWYEIPDALADKLKELHQDHYNDETPFLFDVASEEEAEKIDQKEEEARLAARSSARNPQKFRGRQRTQALPVNNAGPLEDVPGDFTTDDLYRQGGIHGTQPNSPVLPEGDDSDDEGRIKEVGRVGGGAKPRTKQRS